MLDVKRLKETNLKMNQLTEELYNLKRERENIGKIHSIPEKSANMAIEDLNKTNQD